MRNNKFWQGMGQINQIFKRSLSNTLYRALPVICSLYMLSKFS